MKKRIPVDHGDVLTSVRGFLQVLLRTGVVEALYAPLETASGAVVPALVSDPARLVSANPLAPLMPINSARAVSALTNKQPSFLLGAVLRPCEIRALIELVKLNQASLERTILIGIDCPGSFELREFYKVRSFNNQDISDFITVASEGREPVYEGLELRSACRMCLHPVADQADIHIHLFGEDLTQGLPVTIKDHLVVEEGLQEVESGDDGRSLEVIENLIARHREFREGEIQSLNTRISTNSGLAAIFDTCLRCHNCATVCPICYCQTCLFRTASFVHQPNDYLSAAHRKGALRMLSDTLLFHLTRLNHMSASCVSCGICTSACPVDIPVGTIFTAIGEKVQAVLGYSPGQDVAEPLPLVTFKPDEWVEIGEVP